MVSNSDQGLVNHLKFPAYTTMAKAFGLWMLSLLFFIFTVADASSSNESQKLRRPIPALFIFGDSTVDSGNNNYLISPTKANFEPNGRDFPGGIATGRFCNGKLATDIFSERLGLPDTVPAFLDPEFQGQRILTGASFASAASGYFDATPQETGVLTIGQQVNLFRLYKLRLLGLVGPVNASKIISEGLFIISAGTVDFTNLYYLNPLMQLQFDVQQYQNILLKGLTDFTQNIYADGGRRLIVMSLPPFGCLPSQITLHNLFKGKCVDKMNKVANETNARMKEHLNSLTSSLPGLSAQIINVYDILLQLSLNPQKYGFEEARRGCCGTGLIEASILCNPLVPACKNASTHVYWDSYHPTTAAYKFLVDTLFKELRV